MRKMVFGLILCLLLSGCGGPSAEERAEGPPVQIIQPEEDWRTAYAEFLENLCEEEKAEYRNYIFDLYGTLVDISTNEAKTYSFGVNVTF